jgi:hypothetical protein
MIQTQTKVLLYPPACKPYGLEANVSLLRNLAVPLNLFLRYLRPRRILPYDPRRGLGSPLRAGGCEADLSAPLLVTHAFLFQ